MNRILTILIAGILAITSQSTLAETRKSILVVSEEWSGFVNAAGEGYYMDLLREIFPAHQYELDLKITPYARSLALAKSDKAHIVLGIWANEFPNERISHYPIEVDLIDAIVREKQLMVQGPSSFNGLRVLSRTGYGFDVLLDRPLSYTERIDVPAMLHMISNNRADVLLDYKQEITPALRRSNYKNLKLVENVLSEFVVFGFCGSHECDELKRTFDARYTELYHTGFIDRSIRKHTGKGAAVPPLTPMQELW